MGVAQNQAELNRVIETARTISGVKQVVSYVKLAGEALAKEEPQTLSASEDRPVMVETNTNLKTNPENSVSDDIGVPARKVDANAPTIEDQYYN